jgi:hypothetical protein
MSFETGAWLGRPKAQRVKMSEIDSSIWIGKQEAATMLNVQPRQVERRAQQGRIERRLLPRVAGEKAARVVYSRDDIERLQNEEHAERMAARAEELAARPPAEDVDPSQWVPKLEAAKIINLSVRQVEHLAAKGELRKRTLPKALSERAARVAYYRPDLEDILSGNRKNPAVPFAPAAAPPAGVLALPAALIDALRERRELPAPAPRPWLTLTEAVEYSGLPASWLLAQARRGVPWALNVGQGIKAHWRFNRNAFETFPQSS